MTDPDMETEAAGLHIFISVDARRERKRQRHAEQAAAPHHQPHPLAFDHQRHCKVERAEALAQQTRVAALAFLLRALELLSRKVALPKLAPVLQAKGDLDRQVIARGRKADNGGRKPREQAFTPLDARNAGRSELTPEFVHDLQRLRQRRVGVTEDATVERLAMLWRLPRSGDDA